MRATDSLFRQYQVPGHTELDNILSPFSLSKRELREQQAKKNLLAQAGSKALGVVSQSNACMTGIQNLAEHKQKDFKKSYGEFYGVSNKDGINTSYNKILDASKAEIKPTAPSQIPSEI
jgi:hypothetical protein